MNNYELHEAAQLLSDTETPYALAKRVIELEQSMNQMKADAIINTANEVMCALDSTRQDEWHQETINRAIALRSLK